MSLRDEIQARKLTQRFISEIAGVSEPTVSNWCNGVRLVPPLKARLLHSRLGIPLTVMNPLIWPPRSAKADAQPCAS